MLPLALQATSLVTPIVRGCRAYGPDRVGRCTQLVICHMSHRHGVTGGASRFLRGPGRLSGCGVSGVACPRNLYQA